jgi:bla regulator protein blaR1
MIIAKYFSDVWAAVAPAAGNHLWQSTLFAVVAGLFTLMLRKNQARARYWLWLAASLKFLIPFSLLVGVGGYFGWSHASAGTNSGVYFAMEEISQPFAQSAVTVASHANPSASSTSVNLLQLLPMLVAAVWLCGFLSVVLVWFVRWRRMSAAMREAVPLREGREVKALRRLERAGGIRKRIEVFLSRASLEPGIFGIARPVLVWPEGISARLDDAHVEAILAHEVGHVRRRDNLFAAIHMLVEAIFWFHPLVWFLGTRLVEEREVACDEEVLELGSERQVYAESILKICEFCVGSPLACVSGVTGADLKKRIVRIMSECVPRKMNFSKKLMLSVATLAAIVVPIVFGVAYATPIPAQSQTQATTSLPAKYEFEVAVVKLNKSGGDRIALYYTPDGFTAANVSLRVLIRFAYGPIDENRILGESGWFDSEKYDIQAKVDSSFVDELQKLNPTQLRVERQHMLQSLLADRFKLTVSREAKELPVYALVIAKNGPKLQESKPGDTYLNGRKSPDGRTGAGLYGERGGPLTGQGVTMATLSTVLSQQQLGRIVLDKTELTGKYDFTLQWAPDQAPPSASSGEGGGQSTTDSVSRVDSSGPSIFSAIQEQLGLKLDSQKAPIEVLVIDHAERPSGN